MIVGCRPKSRLTPPRRVMPAGLPKVVDASSARAARPALAVPTSGAAVSYTHAPPAHAVPEPSNNPIAAAIDTTAALANPFPRIRSPPGHAALHGLPSGPWQQPPRKSGR